MIYLFTGTDVDTTRRKAFMWVEAAREKESQVLYTRVAREELSPNRLAELSESSTLFVTRQLVLIDDPFARAKVEEGEEASPSVLDEWIDALEHSNNVFVIVAPNLPAAKEKKLGPRAKKIYRFDSKTYSPERGFNSALVNALLNRSREKLWLEVTRALRAGDAPEMLHGLLHWKARDILEKGARAWTPAEARKLSLSLIETLQSSRRGGVPLAEALEAYTLSI